MLGLLLLWIVGLVIEPCAAAPDCPPPPTQFLVGKMVSTLQAAPIGSFSISPDLISPTFAAEIHGFFQSYKNHTGSCTDPFIIETRPFTIYEKGNPNKFVSLVLGYSGGSFNFYLDGKSDAGIPFTCCQVSVSQPLKFHFMVALNSLKQVVKIRLKESSGSLLTLDLDSLYGTEIITKLGSFSNPMLAVGGTDSKGCFTGELFNWIKKISPVASLDIYLTDERNKRLASVLEYWVLKPQLTVGPAERFVYDLSSPLTPIAKTSGGHHMNDFSYTNYHHHIHTDDQFSFVSPDQALRFIRNFPIQEMVRGGSNSLLVTGKLTISPVRTGSSPTDPWCGQTYSNLQDGAFLIYSVVFDGGQNMAGIYAKVRGCTASNNKILEVTIYADRSSSSLYTQQINFEFSGTTAQTFEFLFDIFKDPKLNTVTGLVNFTHFKDPLTRVSYVAQVDFTTTDIGQQFMHGIGNIRRQPSDLNSHYHIFRYQYQYLTVSLGGYQDNVRLGCLDKRILIDDNTMIAVGAYSDPSIASPISFPVFCQGMDDILHREGCKPKLSASSIPNCFADFMVNSNLLCAQCNPGYFRVNLNTCVACQTYCFRCSDTLNCQVCKLGFVRMLVNGNYVCQQVTASATTIYSPEYQSLVPAVDGLFKSTVPQMNTVATTHIYTITGSTVGYKLYLEADIDASSSLARTQIAYQIIFSIGNKEVQLRHVWDTVTGKLKLFALKHETEVLGQDILLTLTSPMTFKITSFKVNLSPIGFDSDPCLIPTSSGDCLFCNSRLNYYLPTTKPTCDLVPLGTYVEFNNKVIGLPDSKLSFCPPQTGMARCMAMDPAKASECLPNYYLSSGACLPCPGSPCTACVSAKNCTMCASGHFLLNTTLSLEPVDGSCVAACSVGMAPDTQGVCQVCPPDHNSDGLTCYLIVIQSSTEFVKGTASWDLNQLQYIISFDHEFELSNLKNDFTLSFNSNLLTVDFLCFATAGVRRTCSSKVEIKDRVEINNEDIVLEINSMKELAPGVVVPKQIIPLSNRISYYRESAQQIQSIKGLSTGVTTAGKAATAVSLVSSGASFAGFLKLTQYIEMLLYFNVAYPSNFQAFLGFFSQNLFDFMFNPFEKLSDPRCSLEYTYRNNGIDCLLLQNAGQIYMIAGGLIALKYLSKLLKWSSRSMPKLSRVFGKPDDYLIMGAWLMLFDGVMFDLLLAAGINMKRSELSSWSISLNTILSCIMALLYLIETVFCIVYLHYFHKQKVCSELKIKIQKLTGKVSLKVRLLTWIKELKIDYYTQGRNQASFVSRFSVALFKIRSLLSVAFLLSFFDSPKLQIGSIVALHATTAVLLLVRRPSSSRLENLRVLTSEISLAVSMSIAAVLSDPSLMPSQKKRYWYLGFSLIGIIGFLFMVNIASSIVEAVMTVKEFICHKKQPSSESEKQRIPSLIDFNKISNGQLGISKNSLSTILSSASSPKRLNMRRKFTRVVSQSPTLKK